MSRSATPRRHHHLNREAIARAALDLVDLEGVEALSMRKLAAALHVRATNLYPYVADKESILCDVVALLLSEIDLSERPGVGWEELVISVGASLREMAMRHPRAFPLVALARYDEWPLIDYTLRVERLLLSAGLPKELQARLASMLDAYATGYLLLATQVLTRSTLDSEVGFAGQPAGPSRAVGVTNTPQEYEEGTRTIIAGFKQRNGIPDAPATEHPAEG
jgi:TetR/AcrR family tetracycline transcriptional repressor